MAALAFIGIGSNQGDRGENLRRAMERLGGLEDTKVLRASSIYRTEPVGRTDQPEFLNMAAELETSLAPGELMKTLLEIEKGLGRTREERWGPRTVDLDILYYGNQVVKGPDLEIPHPRAHQRAFVLEPLSELAPELVDPISGKTVREMLAGLDRRGQGVEKAGSIKPDRAGANSSPGKPG